MFSAYRHNSYGPATQVSVIMRQYGCDQAFFYFVDSIYLLYYFASMGCLLDVYNNKDLFKNSYKTACYG